MTCMDTDIATKGRREVLETAHILLEAGCDPVFMSDKASPIDSLLHQTVLLFGKLHRYDQSYVSTLALQLPLVAELVELLLKRGAITTCGTKSSLSTVIDIAAIFVQGYMSELEEIVSDHLDPHDAVMNSLGDMYRCLMLAERYSSPSNIGLRDDMIDDQFVDSFVSIARYSSLAGRSRKLFLLIVHTLSTNQILTIHTNLEQRPTSSWDSTPGDLDVATSCVTSWVSNIRVPFDLQHLARLAILRAMSCRSLHGVSSLGLPHVLQQYILLKSY